MVIPGKPESLYQSDMTQGPYRIENHEYKQILHLGLEDILPQGGAPLKWIDIACGMKANLVRHIKGFGFDIEGIDPLVEPCEFLMKGKVDRPGAIPRPDSTYRFAVTHWNPVMYLADGPFFRMVYDRVKGKVRKTLREGRRKVIELAKVQVQEVLRVLDSEGKFLVYPAIAGSLQQQIGNYVKDSGREFSRMQSIRTPDEVIGELSDDFLSEEFLETENFVTVIKPKSL